MVTRPSVNIRRPAVHMNVLDFDFPSGDRRRDEHVVELLVEVVEHVRVLLL